ncbi:efflux RND transporter periplasmic adaptor subunit [Ectopseudomonas alcaliphila]|uniref:Efflux RND transporter periplasmic adaptor subunit n=1 Tax=Ectopseudomonas alcaliphila TaxID=101564 RepID=A0A1G6W3G9_9GAMM|nr:efflux RND transporter periplasmic adaptor subunit [Pseudomonas alcaliphila]MDX5991944.1 efflux RND transporter periplasmic adaptor subunit [Pseudomonas alcaliphila]SDD60354.1 membrane fusion protein, multidrug efflux system [Pseudomonas alcaliphila]
MGSKYRHLSSVLAGLAVLALAGCDAVQQGGTAPAPLQVSVLTLEAHELSVSEDLPARVAAVRSAEIRAQIGGIVQRRLFEQGAEIKAGAVLFQINPAPFKAEVDSAAAALQRAEAVLSRARVQAERLTSLVQAEAVSRQLYDDAVAQREQAAADVAQARATLARRKLDLQFASVEAPIAGRIDQALVSEGALVSPTDATPMARIQQIDQVYVDVRQSASILDALRQQAGSATPELSVEILGSDGKPLGMRGRILFSGIEVDAGTGDVLLRVLVDNPQRRLLPGLYVQARIPRAHYPAALSVPQQAVTRTAGQASVWVVDAQGQVQPVRIELGELVERRYRVVSGLSAGQQVVVEGIERLSPDAQVATRAWQPAVAREQLSAVAR